MRKILVVLLTIILLSIRIEAQEKIYLPIIFNEGNKMAQQYPILAINSESGERINLLEKGSGVQLADPYWSPNITQLKGGGTFVNPQTASGRALVHAEYDNVIETIPLRITGEQGWITIRNLRRMLNLSVNAQSYWTQIFEQDRVWLEIRADCDNHLTGYSTIYTISLPNITSPYTRPFVNPIDKSQFDTISMVIEREPFWSPLEPGEIIGPLYNLIRNPDFELWNFGVTDSQPDSWNNLHTVSIVGTNNRTQSDVKWGNNALEIAVTGSTAIGEAKGVTQVLENVENNTTYTVLAWVKNDGVSNGVGRILITYSDQLELYRDSNSHDWQLYSGTITTDVSDVVGISVEILSTANNTLGTIYVDGLMFLKDDWEQEASDNLLGYMTASHIVNHQDTVIGIIEAGDINYADMWNIPGDVDSFIRLEIENSQEPADNTNPVEQYSQLRIGMRRTGDIFNFDNILDIAGNQEDTTCSSDNRLNTDNLGIGYLEIVDKLVIDNTDDNQGRFKLLARVYDEKASGNSNLDCRAKYFTGSTGINEVVLPKVTPLTREQWTVIDLTDNEFINQDLKFTPDQLSQLGYTIEMKRDSGTDKVRFDYSIIMPTDGGYIDTTINPALTKGTKLVVDSTSRNINVNTTFDKVGWQLAYSNEDAPTVGHEFGIFRGALYTVADLNGVSTERLFLRSYQSNVWEVVDVINLEAANSVISKFIEYNNKLYGLSSGSNLYSSSDGVNFSLEVDTINGLYDLEIFNGLLFVAGINKIQTWDGSSLSDVYNLANTTFRDLVIYKSKLYAVGRDAATNLSLYEYDSTLNTFTLHSAINGMVLTNLLGKVRSTVFNGKLYVTGNNTVGNPAVSSWDGNPSNTWETSFNANSDLATLWTIANHNNKIYIGGSSATGNPSKVYESSDGDTWTAVYDEQGYQVRGMISFNGVLYIGINQGTDTGSGEIQWLSEVPIVFKQTEFKGGGFSAPSRTEDSDSRHRYFFSYDRENFINNIDDKALIGIGYRPRYFSLINVDEF